MPKKTMCYRCMKETVVNGFCTECGAPAENFVQSENELVLPPGTMLDEGNIMVGTRLGSGGFGITYVARDKKFGVITLKEFVPRYMINGRRGLNLLVNPDKQGTYEKTMRSFHRESKLLSKLRHPNIVRVLFEMEENNTAYYGMELMQGEDLGKYLRNLGRPMSPRQLCELLIPAIDALIYLHGVKALHRDLSPDNIFLQRDSASPLGLSPCLIDFGAASSARQDFSQTVPGVKKNGYSPLEQNWDRSQQGAFTDVYAFAATLYYALTLKVPLPAGDRLQSGRDVLQSPKELNSEISSEVNAVIMRGLALKSEDRTQDMRQFGLELCKATGVIPPEQWRQGKSQWGNSSDPPVRPTPKPAPEPAPKPTPEPHPDPVPPVASVSPVPPVPTDDWPDRMEHSPANLFSLLLDGLVLVGIPALLLMRMGQGGKDWFGVAIIVGLLLVLNLALVCVKPRGTLGQRILGLQLYTSGTEPTLHALSYAVLRILLPLSVLDALIGMISGSATLLERMTNVRVALGGIEEKELSSVPLPDPPPNPPPNPPQGATCSAKLICRSGEYQGKVIMLFDDRGLTIGRDSNYATLRFQERNSKVSHKHCSLVCRADGWHLTDCSSYGTYINKKRIPFGEPGNLLKNGDEIRIGDEIFIFRTMRGGS